MSSQDKSEADRSQSNCPAHLENGIVKMTRFTHIFASLALTAAILPYAANAATTPGPKMQSSNAAQVRVADDLALVHPEPMSGQIIVHSGINPNSFRDFHRRLKPSLNRVCVRLIKSRSLMCAGARKRPRSCVDEPSGKPIESIEISSWITSGGYLKVRYQG